MDRDDVTFLADGIHYISVYACDSKANCKKTGPGKNKCTCQSGYTGVGTAASPCSGASWLLHL